MYAQLRHILGTLLLACSFLTAEGQVFIELHPVDEGKEAVIGKLNFKKEVNDETEVRAQLKAVLKQLRAEAYLAASIDSVVVVDSLHRALLFVGDTYEWGRLSKGNVDEITLSQIGFKEKIYKNKPLRYEQMARMQEKLLTQLENNGHPFALVSLDSVRVVGNEISAQLFLDKQQLVLLDEINQEGPARISNKYLAAYLGLNKGDLYNESKIRRISSRIKELGFLQETQAPYLTFVEGKATVNLFLEDKKSSQFDLLLGFLPKNKETGKLILTGQAEIDLENPFGTGKEIRIAWEQLRPETQQLDLHFLYPYLLNLPFGLDLNFDLYKRDTTYLDLNWDVGIQYHFEGRNYLKAFWHNSLTNVLNVDTSRVISQKKLPENLDVTNATFGLEYRFEKLDYRFNPRSGWELLLRGGAGIKRVKENQQVLSILGPETPVFDYGSLYDSLSTRSYQFSLKGRAAYYIPVTQRTVVKAGLSAGALIAEGDIYQNELFRIGGMQLLRGFDEESVFASFYAVMTGEFRFMIGQNSYLYAFGDFAHVQNRGAGSNSADWPIGFGVGMTFETKAGVFGINYALGRQQKNPIDFGAGKIHFGYVNYF